MVTSGDDVGDDNCRRVAAAWWSTEWLGWHEHLEVRVVVRRVVAWRWRVGGGDEGDATVGMVAAGGSGDSSKYEKSDMKKVGSGDVVMADGAAMVVAVAVIRNWEIIKKTRKPEPKMTKLEHGIGKDGAKIKAKSK
ncbi:hypothetical protein Tco_0115265 [Tanacetum coccineum]